MRALFAMIEFYKVDFGANLHDEPPPFPACGSSHGAAGHARKRALIQKLIYFQTKEI